MLDSTDFDKDSDFYKKYGTIPPPEGLYRPQQVAERMKLNYKDPSIMLKLTRIIEKLRFAKIIPNQSEDTDRKGHLYGQRDANFLTVYTKKEADTIVNGYRSL